MASEELRMPSNQLPSKAETSTAKFADVRFVYQPDGIYKVVNGRKGQDYLLRLTNFLAKITLSRKIIDGMECRRLFELEVVIDDHQQILWISAEELASRDWYLKHIDGNPIVFPGRDFPELVRTAIQLGSSPINEEVYMHLGWILTVYGWVFLHSAGAIGANSEIEKTVTTKNRNSPNSQIIQALPSPVPKVPISNERSCQLTRISIEPPAFLQHYRLPKPPTEERLHESIRKVLQLLDLGPRRITIPLLSAVFLASLSEVRFSILLEGPSGAFKSGISLLFLAFFAPEASEEDLVGWDSTSNGVKQLLHYAKNVPLILDDLAPRHTRGGTEAADRKADEILRSHANRSAKHRATGMGTLREGKPSQALLISTAERRPSGVSLNARILTLEVEHGDFIQPGVTAPGITAAQEDAKAGRYAEVMSGFLRYVAPEYEDHLSELQKQFEKFRGVFSDSAVHPRQVDTAANLLSGFDAFLDFAWQSQAISDREFEALWESAHDALRENLAQSKVVQLSQDPVNRFLELLRSALACGRAHLKILDDDDDESIISRVHLGYSEHQVPVPDVEKNTESDDESDAPRFKTVCQPRGAMIGWKKYDSIYLIPKACLALVNRYAAEIGIEGVFMEPKTLGKRLYENGFILSHTKDRNTLKQKINGILEEVLHLSKNRFFGIQDLVVEGYVLDGLNDLEEQEERSKREADRQQWLCELETKRQKTLMRFFNEKILGQSQPLPDLAHGGAFSASTDMECSQST